LVLTEQLEQPCCEILENIAERFSSFRQGSAHHIFTLVDENAESVKEQCLRLRTVMLEKIERDPSILIERYNFTVQKRIGPAAVHMREQSGGTVL
jgi:hypothetical protein